MGLVDLIVGKGHAELAKESGGLTSATGYNGYYVDRSSRKALTTYSTNPWVNAATSVIARDVASVPWKLFQPRNNGPSKRKSRWVKQLQRRTPGSKTYEKNLVGLLANNEAEEVIDHPLLDLLEEPNAVMDRAYFMFVIMAQYDLVGEFFLLREVDAQGRPTALIPIPPCAVVRTPDGTYTKYDVQWGRVRREYDEDQIIHVKSPDPLHPLGRGVGMAKSLATEIDTDENAAQFTAARFNNFALPSFLVGVEGAQKEDLERAKKTFIRDYQGARKAFLTHWHPGKVQVQNLTPNFKELQLIELRKFERNTILQKNQIPPEIIGIVENSNRSTIDAADYFYKSRVIVPRMNILQSAFTQHLLRAYGDSKNLILHYENPIPEDRQHVLSVMKEVPESFTINEWRAQAGHGPIDGGDVFYTPTTYSSGVGGGDGGDTPSEDDENADEKGSVVDKMVYTTLHQLGIYETDETGRSVVSVR